MAPIRITPRDRTQLDLCPEQLEHWGAVTRDYKNGSIEDIDRLPKTFVGRKLDTRVTGLSDFFIGGGFLMVSQRCADVFAQHDLGRGGFSAIEIVQGNRQTLATTDSFFILNIAARKHALLPDHCNRGVFASKIQVKGGIERYSEIDLADDDCALSAASLDGPDVWLDPAVANSFFMSGRLVGALQADKLTKNMSLRRCRIVSPDAWSARPCSPFEDRPMRLRREAFATACYESRCLEQLLEALAAETADANDLRTWDIDEAEWRQGLRDAATKVREWARGHAQELTAEWANPEWHDYEPSLSNALVAFEGVTDAQKRAGAARPCSEGERLLARGLFMEMALARLLGRDF